MYLKLAIDPVKMQWNWLVHYYRCYEKAANCLELWWKIKLRSRSTCWLYVRACVQNEYLGLVDQCMVFACELMDLCRGTQEVEAVLSEGGDRNGSSDPLARLKMALEYEEKKVPIV